ncbi:MAG TPA: hypothetical protein PLP01_10340 [Phycisphaerae bacterium]|nr:hypothetical protein [Phycisphaerae bacterium]
MVWIILLLVLLAILVVDGAAQQVRVVLFNEWQAELSEKRRREIEDQKKQAAEKIRSMLAEKRDLGDSPTEEAPAPASAADPLATSARPARPHGASRAAAASS